eukprot:gene17079-12218_t
MSTNESDSAMRCCIPEPETFQFLHLHPSRVTTFRTTAGTEVSRCHVRARTVVW